MFPTKLGSLSQSNHAYLNEAKKILRSHSPNNKTLVGVHVRRGDFITKRQYKRGRVVVGKTYLQKSMTFFLRKHKDPIFVVVSSSVEWSKENIPDKDVFLSNFTEPIIDMAILSLCDHTVTGTFGCWGAWLAGGTVVYFNDYRRPGSYVANHTLFREDFHPPSWTGISNGS